ncbi:MAG: NAD(P)-binding domain-containing protein, partial [Stellaceae bacterium]
MSEHFGFIGVGRMGGPMAGRLIDAGHRLTIFDVSEDAMAPLIARGAIRAGSAREVAAACETVFVSLPTPDIVREVALRQDGIIAGGTVKTFIELSTTGSRNVAAIAETLARKGIVTVDSPVSGGVTGAKNGTL